MNELELELTLAVGLLPTVVFLLILNEAILDLRNLGLEVHLLRVDLIKLSLHLLSLPLYLISVHDHLRLRERLILRLVVNIVTKSHIID